MTTAPFFSCLCPLFATDDKDNSNGAITKVYVVGRGRKKIERANLSTALWSIDFYDADVDEGQ